MLAPIADPAVTSNPAVGAAGSIPLGRQLPVEETWLRRMVRLVAVLGLHGLLVVALLQAQDGPAPTSTPVRMAVRLIELPAAEPEAQAPAALPEPAMRPPPEPEARPPEPRPVTVRRPAALPVPTVAAPASPVSAVMAERNPAPAAPVAVTAVRFDAAYLNNPPPAYPILSRRRREQGRVLLQVRVDDRGLPEQVEVQQGSGHARLDQAALDAVRRWRFVPARRGDAAISASVLVPILFQME
jgi:protein TonB